MNWIEKVEQINNDAELTKYDGHFSLLMHGINQRASLLDLEERIGEGDLEAVKRIVSILKPQLEVYRKAVKAAKKYKSCGGIVKTNVKGYCSLKPLKFTKKGELMVYTIYIWNICPFEEQQKFFLWASRLLRDAETRCLKHPKFQNA